MNIKIITKISKFRALKRTKTLASLNYFFIYYFLKVMFNNN